MRKRYLFMAVAFSSCLISFTSMATETNSEPIPEASTVETIEEAATDSYPSETQLSTETEQEAATEQEENDNNEDISIEDKIKDYEQGLNETEPVTETIAEQETPVPETEAPAAAETETEIAETENETEPVIETETETESEYVEVPSEDVTEAMQEIYSYLRYDIGFNHAATCGVISNIGYESDYDPTAVGDSGSSYGLCQWHSERCSALRSYCSNNGFDVNSISGQMAYLSHELSNGFKNVQDYLNSVPDSAQGAYDAAYYWCKHFEMPYNMEACALERASLAQNSLYGKSFIYKKTMKKTVTDIRHEIMEDSFVEASDEEAYQSIINMVRHE